MQLQLPPLDFTDTSILLAIASIILLVTAQLSPTFYGQADSTIDKKKIDNAAIVSGVLFLTTIVIRIVGTMFGL